MLLLYWVRNCRRENGNGDNRSKNWSAIWRIEVESVIFLIKRLQKGKKQNLINKLAKPNIDRK